MKFEHYVIYFFIYALFGYVWEVVFCSIARRKLVNRGYLYMPICPIYGFGAVIVIYLMEPIYEAGLWYLVFILGILLTSILEYFTSLAMEFFFHMRWWDYSHRFLNINGRVCLVNSLFFGILVMILLYVVHPITKELVLKIDNRILIITSIIIIIIYVIDTIFSTIKNINISKMILKLNDYLDENLDFIDDKTALVADLMSNSKFAEKMRKLAINYPQFTIKKQTKLKDIVKKFY